VGEHEVLGTELEEAERSKAMNYLRYVVRQLGADPEGWHCQVEVSKAVAKAIVDLAIWEEVDLIAMYTHDRKGLTKLIKGSIAEKVQRRAPIEVRVFRPQELDEPVAAAVSADEDLDLK
jgi:nucleotide-binding universal stress UspA family protein